MIGSRERIQEEEYNYPYHYLPVLDESGFRTWQYWSWGIHYLGGLRLVLKELQKDPPSSLLDVGCGDGRFLGEVKREWESARLLGVDYSSRAIAMASALNPNVHFAVTNILTDELDAKFAVATCIEVLEHIPPRLCGDFIGAIADTLLPGGRLILTVPHRNKPLNPKHYQHFNSDDLQELLKTRFEVMQMIPFDRKSRGLTVCQKLLGGQGRQYLVTNRHIHRRLFDIYERHFLYAPDEDSCQRVAAVCRRRAFPEV